MSKSSPQQVPLPFRVDNQATFDNYWGEADALLIDQLQRLAVGADPAGIALSPPWVYLAAEAKRGVSHLLQASCAMAQAHNHHANYLNLAELLRAYHTAPDGVFAGFERPGLLCLDDIDALRSRHDWQEQLFYLLERIKQSGSVRLLVGGHAVAAELDFDLADLSSRLKLASGFQLAELSDQQKQQLLIFKAHRLGLVLSEEVSQFLLLRCSRNVGDLLAILQRLDRAAMIDKRKLTIPWVKSVLDL